VPRLRTFVAFLGGLVVAIFVGLVPPELINWFREWGGRGGPDPDEPDTKRAKGRPRRSRERK